MRIITHLGKPLLDGKDMLEVLAESRSVCFAQNQETALQWFLLHQKTLCSQPWNPHGCQVRAISQCLSVMKGFHHTAWPERAQAELAMAPFIPGPQTQQHSAGTALPGVEETLQLSVPAQLGNSPGRKGHPVTAQAPRARPEEAPSVRTGKAEQNNHHMAGLLLLRLQTGRWLPGRPPANGNLGPKP